MVGREGEPKNCPTFGSGGNRAAYDKSQTCGEGNNDTRWYTSPLEWDDFCTKTYGECGASEADGCTYGGQRHQDRKASYHARFPRRIQPDVASGRGGTGDKDFSVLQPLPSWRLCTHDLSSVTANGAARAILQCDRTRLPRIRKHRFFSFLISRCPVRDSTATQDNGLGADTDGCGRRCGERRSKRRSSPSRLCFRRRKSLLGKDRGQAVACGTI
ncbi:hypothetical protein B0H14DRAFT_1045204 [Mycena olivaceomarginata]|nr:hypothetical protein B0H14DRAFT_1045204 [Mycena olivaceomarginata]